MNPLLSGNIAIHFNNRRLQDFVFERLREIWPRQFSVLEADVQEIQNYADHVTLSTDRGCHDFDYVVDCMGTPPAFDGYTMSDCTLMDRCRIHTVKDYDYEPFTDHIATRDGWMFGVPLKGYKTYGYLYSHAFTDTGAAEEEMMRLLGAKASTPAPTTRTTPSAATTRTSSSRAASARTATGRCSSSRCSRTRCSSTSMRLD